MTTDSETLQLNRIFNTLLIDIEAVGNVDFRSVNRDELMGLLRIAVTEAVGVVSQRCSKCDSTKIICIDCGRAGDMIKGVRG